MQKLLSESQNWIGMQQSVQPPLEKLISGNSDQKLMQEQIIFFLFSVFLYSLPNNCKECRYGIARSSQCKLLKYSRSKISLHATKFYEAKFNSFCMCKLLMKINIGATRFEEKTIYKLLCFRKPHVLSRLFIRNFFW